MSERPWYENKSDREREQIIANRFCSWWQFPPGLRPVKRKVDGFTIDFDALLPDDTVRLRFEAKYRHHNFGHYPTLFISEHKLKCALATWLVDEIPVFFAVAFRDCFAYADLCYPAIREVIVGGRYDRNDPYDTEPMLHIPIDQLRKF